MTSHVRIAPQITESTGDWWFPSQRASNAESILVQ